MKITSLSSRSLERWWKFVCLYVGAFICFVFAVALGFVHWNISNPKVSQNFILLFKENIIRIYFFFGICLIFLFCLKLLFSRIVQVQVDEQRRVLYIDGVAQSISRIRYISEITILNMLVVFIKKDGRLQAWIPGGVSYGCITWPLPFFFRKTPKNEYVKLFVSLLNTSL